ncbi:PTS sugar transporter subunit IIA [bacterium]|nr:PTS sugar transporter subunit IIA [bacterium]
MCKIGKFLKKELVLCRADIKTKEELFEYIAGNVESRAGISKETVLKSLSERETYGSTGIGKGVAVPHCRIKGSKEVVVQLISLAEPMPYGSSDGENVSLVFTLIVPEGNNLLYLKLISQISVLCSNEKIRSGLIAAQDPEEMINLISNL